MEELIKVIVTALPFLEGWVSTASVVVTALPAFFAGLPIWLYGLLGGGFLYYAWTELM